MSYKLACIKKTVAATGTAERLTDADLFSPSVIIQAFDDNTNGVHIGDSQVDKTLFNGTELDARESVTFSLINVGSGVELISLRDIWIDVDTNSDGVTATYLQEG